MTIPEAVSLVLQAGAYAHGGEIFVLDMGEPVKIYDLAVNMIKLSGLEPFKDIDIKVTGLRPGEKLYEERLMEEEGLQKTANEMISIGKPLEIDERNLFDKINQLYIEAYNETDRMKELVHELVPTYKIDQRSTGKSEGTKSSSRPKKTTTKKKTTTQSGTKTKKSSTTKTKPKTDGEKAEFKVV
jgi:FlaA1/EpsC-like NDP-sugar epimerase